MRPFSLHHATDPDDAVTTALAQPAPAETPPTAASGQFIAGGTTILDLMKLDVMRPAILVDITALPNTIEATDEGIRSTSRANLSMASRMGWPNSWVSIRT